MCAFKYLSLIECILFSPGHNTVPGIIPEGTLLYHGGHHSGLPPGPEWVTMDPEHTSAYCGGQQEYWFLILVTARPLKVIYFGGRSPEMGNTGSRHIGTIRR